MSYHIISYHIVSYHITYHCNFSNTTLFQFSNTTLFNLFYSAVRRRANRSDANRSDNNDNDTDHTRKEKEKIVMPSRVKRVSVATSSFLLNSTPTSTSTSPSASLTIISNLIPSHLAQSPSDDVTKFQVRISCHLYFYYLSSILCLRFK